MEQDQLLTPRAKPLQRAKGWHCPLGAVCQCGRPQGLSALCCDCEGLPIHVKSEGIQHNTQELSLPTQAHSSFAFPKHYFQILRCHTSHTAAPRQLKSIFLCPLKLFNFKNLKFKIILKLILNYLILMVTDTTSQTHCSKPSQIINSFESLLHFCPLFLINLKQV